MAEEKEVQETEETAASNGAAEASNDSGAEQSGKFEALLTQIDEMTVRDLVDLVEDIEKRYNVSAAAAPMMMAAGGGAGGDDRKLARSRACIAPLIRGVSRVPLDLWA